MINEILQVRKETKFKFCIVMAIPTIFCVRPEQRRINMSVKLLSVNEVV